MLPDQQKNYNQLLSEATKALGREPGKDEYIKLVRTHPADGSEPTVTAVVVQPVVVKEDRFTLKQKFFGFLSRMEKGVNSISGTRKFKSFRLGIEINASVGGVGVNIFVGAYSTHEDNAGLAAQVEYASPTEPLGYFSGSLNPVDIGMAPTASLSTGDMNGGSLTVENKTVSQTSAELPVMGGGSLNYQKETDLRNNTSTETYGFAKGKGTLRFLDNAKKNKQSVTATSPTINL